MDPFAGDPGNAAAYAHAAADHARDDVTKLRAEVAELRAQFQALLDHLGLHMNEADS